MSRPAAPLLLLPLAALAAGTAGCEPGGDPAAAADASRPPTPAGTAELPGMVALPGGTFTLGTDRPPRLHTDESPARPVTLSPFWVDETEVTNDQFAAFVAATGYITAAERPITREDLEGMVPADFLATVPDGGLPPGSVCMSGNFDKRLARMIGRDPNLVVAAGVWQMTEGADWRHPAGPDSTIDGKGDHPVVHVTWEDAAAYAEWAGKKLPTEAQWEYAARGGRAGAEFPWGEKLVPAAGHVANTYQGTFPFKDAAADGYTGTAPVRAFPPNGWGLYAVSGNVWEWCRDWYRPDYYRTGPGTDPAGPADSFDPNEPTIPKRVQRGGSFLCSDNYCTGYRVAGRMKGDPQTGSFHCGFRCVVEDIDAYRSAPARAYDAASQTPAGAK